eukprot:6230171-Prymnesium_polylepis.3
MRRVSRASRPHSIRLRRPRPQSSTNPSRRARPSRSHSLWRCGVRRSDRCDSPASRRATATQRWSGPTRLSTLVRSIRASAMGRTSQRMGTHFAKGAASATSDEARARSEPRDAPLRESWSAVGAPPARIRRIIARRESAQVLSARVTSITRVPAGRVRCVTVGAPISGQVCEPNREPPEKSMLAGAQRTVL